MQRRVRVASYNVLSSSLCSPSYFSNVSDEKWCSSKYRLEGLMKKLRTEIDNNAIICLQEVSLSWTGKLHSFLESNDYAFVVSNYGHRFNGYMGVGIAFPRKEYILAGSDVICVPDTKSGGWIDPSVKQSERNNNKNAAKENVALVVSRKVFNSLVLPVTMLWTGFGSFLTNLRNIWLGKPEFKKKPEGPWELAKNRNNTMVCLRLRHRNPSTSNEGSDSEAEELDFLVATYHMPCQFWEPAAMTIHTAICLQALQQLAEGRYPHILAGDFNFKPSSPQYELTTKGTFAPVVNDPSDPEVHGKASVPSTPLYPNDPFTFTLPRGPLRSAYYEVLGKEPTYTNYAMCGNQTKPFCETLDYIFFRDGEKFKGKVTTLTAKNVVDVEKLGEEILSQGLKSLPSETEYSDHLLIAAEFEINAVEK